MAYLLSLERSTLLTSLFISELKTHRRQLIDNSSSLFPVLDDSLVTGSDRDYCLLIPTLSVLAQQNKQSVQNKY